MRTTPALESQHSALSTQHSSSPPERTQRVALAAIAAFGSGAVYRSFDHVIAAQPGLVALVPIGLVDGDLRGLTDGCPVPWEEAVAILEAPARGGYAVDLRALDMSRPGRLGSRVAGLALTHWDLDWLDLSPFAREILRLTHPSGMRVAVATARVRQVEG